MAEPLMPEATVLTPEEQVTEIFEKARLQNHNLMKSMQNIDQMMVEQYESAGITPPPSIVAAAAEFDVTADARYMGMTEEEIKEVQTNAVQGGGAVAWTLDKLLRTTYAPAAMTQAGFDALAPPQSEIRSTIQGAFRNTVDVFNATGDESAAFLTLVEGLQNDAIVPKNVSRELSLAKKAILADPARTPLYLFNGVRRLWDWFREPAKQGEAEGLVDRIKLIGNMGSAAPFITMAPFANELFSGLGPLAGKKQTLMGEGQVLEQITGIPAEETPTWSDFGAKRLARDLGLNPAEVTGTDISLGVPGASVEAKFRDKDGTVRTAKIADNVHMIPNPFGDPIPVQFMGPRIGVTEDGEGILAIRRGGLLDPNAADAAGLVGEFVLDPLTYTGIGAEAKVLGRPLSQKGIKLLEAETRRVRDARRMLVEQTAKEKGPDAAEALVKELRQNPSRLEAEKIVVDAATQDPSLLAPRGEVRFMGVPVGALGGKADKTTLVKQLVDKANVEKLWAKFEKGLPKAAPRVKHTYENVEGMARQISSWFKPNLAKQEEWLYARAAAQGVAMSEQAVFDKKLSVLTLDKAEEDLAMQLMGDPLNMVARPPLQGNVERVAELADELDARYAGLHQEVTKEVPLATVQDWIDTLPQTGRSELARKLQTRLNEVLAANPEAKGLPRTEVFFNNSDELLKEYTTALAEEFTRFRHETLNKLGKTVKAMARSKTPVHPRNLKDVSHADRRLMTRLWDALDKGGNRGFNKAMARLKQSLDDKGQMLVGKGDFGSLITPLSRDELLDLLENVRRRSKLYALSPVDNPRQHLFLRSQVVNNKEAYQYLLSRTASLVQDDAFARRVFERYLTPIGVLNRNANINQKRVQDAWDSYKLARAKQGGPVYAESAGFSPLSGRGSRVKIGDTTKPAGAPMSAALSKLKTKEEIQQFVRQWLVDPAEGRWADGSMSYRFYQFLQAMHDNAVALSDNVVEQFPVAPGAGKKERLLQFTMDQFANEARELRSVLASKGMALNDVLPKVNLTGHFADDGSRWVLYKKLKREGKSWRLLGSNTGDSMYVPRSIAAELDRMSSAKMRSPEMRGFLSYWDGYTNFTKLGLTAVGGFPSFQVRNLYTNVAFMMLATHVNLIRTAHKIPKMVKASFLNSDPSLAVTPGGYRGTLRTAVMNELAMAPEATVNLAGVKAAVKQMYASGAKSKLPGRKAAAKLAADDKALTKEAQILLDNLNEVVVRTDLGHEYTMRDIMRESRLQGVDIDSKVLAEFTGHAERFASSKTRAKVNAARDKLMRLNTFFEQWSRQQLFITYLSRGVGPEEAGRLVNKWLLDYRAASPVEQNLLKRLIPFYQFYRRALPVMVESMFTRPGVNSAFARLATDPHEPQFSYVQDDGTAVTLQDDGETLQVLGNVDMPQTAVIKFFDALKVWDPDTSRKGFRELALLGHPAFHALLDVASSFEIYRGKIDEKERYNALGQAMEKIGIEEGSLYIKEKNYNGEWEYKFDKTLLTAMVDAAGLGRLFSFGDRSVEMIQDLNDNDFTGFLRWFSGLRLEEWSGDEVRTRLIRKVTRAVQDEMEKRGLAERGSRFILMTPDVKTRREAERRRERTLLGREE